MGFREKEALLRKEGYYILQSLHLHQIPLSIVIHPLLNRGMEKPIANSSLALAPNCL
jgi:hypothetical protein